MDEDLIATLHSRLRSFRDDGDVSQVTEFEALRDTTGLVGAMLGAYNATGKVDMTALHAIADMFLARAQAAPDDERREAELDLLRAALTPVAAAVPEPLRQALGISLPPAVDLNARYEVGLTLLTKAAGGDSEAIDGAVEALREVVGLLPPGSRNLPAVLSNLATALKMRYEQTDAEEDLTFAQAAAQAAVSLDEVGLKNGGSKTTGYGIHQAVYGQLASMAYRRTPERAHAVAAVGAYRAAREALPRDHPARSEVVTSSLQLLHALMDDFGDMEVFDEAVELARENLGQPDDPGYPDRLTALGSFFQQAYERTGDTAYLDTALDNDEQAMALMPPGHGFRAATLTNANLHLRLKYEITGDPEYLEKAIAAGREAVAAGQEGHPALFMYLNGLNALALALRHRFALTGELSSLEEAIELGREATQLSPPGNLRAQYLTGLSHALELRHARIGSAADLDEAVEAARSAVSEYAPQNQDRALLLANLAGVLGTIGTLGALTEAVDVLREARGLLPADHSTWHLCGANLCSVLRSRYELTHGYDDLAEAIAVGRETIAIAGAQFFDAYAQLNLGLALGRSYQLDGDPAAAAEAIHMLRGGARLATQRPSLRLQFATEWAALAAATGDWPEAAQAYELAVELHVRLAARHLRRADLEHQLASGIGLIANAAGCAVRAGDPSLAVRILEQGRGIMLSQALDLRGDMSELEAQAPELAARFRAFSSALEDTQPFARTGAVSDSGYASDGDRRAAYARDWDALLAQIRSRPGLKSFLRSPDEAELRAAASGGPIVIVNMSRFGSDAVIVTADRVAAVPLPGLTSEACADRGARFLMATYSLTGRRGDPAREVVMDTLAWLWEVHRRAGPLIPRYHRAPRGRCGLATPMVVADRAREPAAGAHGGPSRRQLRQPA